MEPVIIEPILHVDDKKENLMGFNYVLQHDFQIFFPLPVNKGLYVKLPGINCLKVTRIKEKN